MESTTELERVISDGTVTVEPVKAIKQPYTTL
jgi:hypothetical protein